MLARSETFAARSRPRYLSAKGGLCFAAIVAAGLSVAGCASPVDRAVATSPVAEDYHLRHPVVLANAPQILDVFAVGPTGKLDDVQLAQLQSFGRGAIAEGQSGITIAVPEGAVDRPALERTVGAVRRELLRLGIRGGVQLASYRVHDPAIAAPLHLSYLSLQARPTTQCGQWPADLGPSDGFGDLSNRSYYNLGCASQQTLAAQIADPRDLAKPRTLDPTDVQLRTRAIGDLRAGQDPSTQWNNNPLAIGTVGGF